MVLLTRCCAMVAVVLALVHNADASTSISSPPRANKAVQEKQQTFTDARPRKRRGPSDPSTSTKKAPVGQTVTEEVVSILSPIKAHRTRFVAECKMPTSLGEFRMRSYAYSSEAQNLEPIVMIYGDVEGQENVIVRVHDQCFTSEVFGSMRCDCREQLEESLKLVREKSGIIIYLQQEGRGIGIANKVAAYSLQDSGVDTVDANIQLGFKDELREYMAVPDILNDLNIKSIKILTNNPFKINQLTALGVKISERISIQIPSNQYSAKYLLTKRDKMNHLFNDDISEHKSVYLSLNNDKSINFGTTGHSAANVAAPVAEYPSQHVQMTHSVEYEVLDRGIRKEAVYMTGGNVDVEPGHDITKGYAFGRHTVEAAITAIREGKIVLVTDDEGRENEGDLIMAAELATADTIGFIVRYTSGVLCVSMENDRLEELRIPPMVVDNEDPKQTAYTVSVDYKHGITTGISSADRAAAFRGLADPRSTASDFQRPGHVFPLRYRPGGVIVRGGHTEASLDLTRLAGLQPAGVLAEVVNDDGSVMRLPELMKMAEEHGLVITSVQDIIAYRLETEGNI